MIVEDSNSGIDERMNLKTVYDSILEGYNQKIP